MDGWGGDCRNPEGFPTKRSVRGEENLRIKNNLFKYLAKGRASM